MLWISLYFISRTKLMIIILQYNNFMYSAGTVCEHLMSGLLIIRGKKSQISPDFWRQIRGENGRFRGNFTGIFGANFTEKQRRKPRRKIPEKKDILEGCQIQGKKENTKVHPTQF